MKSLEQAAAKLIAESNRYRTLCCAEARLHLLAVLPDMKERHLKLAREHDLRAETFRDAASVIQKP